MAGGEGGSSGENISYEDFWEKITSRYGDDIAEKFKAFGDDGENIISRYGDDAVDIVRGLPDNEVKEAIELINQYGDDAVELLNEGRTIKQIKVIMKNGGYNPYHTTNVFGQEKTVLEKDLETIKEHLSGEFSDDYNYAMIQRIEKAFANGHKISGADLDFYLHELYEAEMMNAGMGYSEAHKAAKEYYDALEFNLYSPEVIKLYPKEFNNAWFEFWRIVR